MALVNYSSFPKALNLFDEDEEDSLNLYPKALNLTQNYPKALDLSQPVEQPVDDGSDWGLHKQAWWGLTGLDEKADLKKALEDFRVYQKYSPYIPFIEDPELKEAELQRLGLPPGFSNLPANDASCNALASAGEYTPCSKPSCI